MINALMLVAALQVRHATKVEPRSWQPLEVKALEQLLEQKTLDQLTKQGGLHLQRSGFADLKSGDYALLIEGRFIEDAGKFTVYLTFSPGTKAVLPSFYVLDTAEVEGRSPTEMQAIIQALVARAASRLEALLVPRLQDAAPSVESAPMPLDFGAISLPDVSHPTGAVAILMNVRNTDDERQTAYLALGKHVFDQPNARMAIERCAIADPWSTLRADCVEALAPVARARLETQRLLLAAMRNEIDPRVLGVLTSVSKSFVGLSRKEAIATWLDVLSATGTPGDAAQAIAEALREEGQLPNLELAITRCLAQQTLAQGKRRACAMLLQNLSAPQRVRAVYRYLEQLQTAAPDNVVDALEEHVWGRGSEPLDPTLAELLLRIAPEPRVQGALPELLYALRRFPHPTEQTIAQLLRVADNSVWASDALDTVQCLVEAEPKLKPSALSSLQRMRGHRFMRRRNSSDPTETLERVIARVIAVR